MVKIMEEIRLQKFLAEAGIASRRKCETYIKEGKVKVNGKTAQIGDRVKENDNIYFNGKKVKKEEKKVYILLNKPIGYVTTVKDEYDNKKVTDLVNVKERVVPVGRLDINTTGALLFSNDGEFIYHITHPKHEIEKTYIVQVKGSVSQNEIEKLQKGIKIENYVTKPAKVKLINSNENTSELEIIIHEGKNRQVRKMMKAIQKEVIKLHRSKIGKLNVKDLKMGTWRYLKPHEVDKINETW